MNDERNLSKYIETELKEESQGILGNICVQNQLNSVEVYV